MTVAEILDFTGASRATFYRWRSARGFPAPTGIGHFDKQAVLRWWEANYDQVGRWPINERPA